MNQTAEYEKVPLKCRSNMLHKVEILKGNNFNFNLFLFLCKCFNNKTNLVTSEGEGKHFNVLVPAAAQEKVRACVSQS